MFVQLARQYWARSIEIEQELASRLTSRLQPHVTRTGQGPGLDVLRHRLDEAKRRVLEKERLVAGWREIIESDQTYSQKKRVARDLLKEFRVGLEVAVSEKVGAENALVKRLLDLFEGMTGHLPENDHELHAWLASPEGRGATAFELTSLSPWGERGRS